MEHDKGLSDHTELNITDGKVLFEWRSLDHIGPEGTLTLTPLIYHSGILQIGKGKICVDNTA